MESRTGSRSGAGAGEEEGPKPPGVIASSHLLVLRTTEGLTIGDLAKMDGDDALTMSLGDALSTSHKRVFEEDDMIMPTSLQVKASLDGGEYMNRMKGSVSGMNEVIEAARDERHPGECGADFAVSGRGGHPGAVMIHDMQEGAIGISRAIFSVHPDAMATGIRTGVNVDGSVTTVGKQSAAHTLLNAKNVRPSAKRDDGRVQYWTEEVESVLDEYEDSIKTRNVRVGDVRLSICHDSGCTVHDMTEKKIQAWEEAGLSTEDIQQKTQAMFATPVDGHISMKLSYLAPRPVVAKEKSPEEEKSGSRHSHSHRSRSRRSRR